MGTAVPHCFVSCGSTNLLSGLLLVNPIKQGLAGTLLGLLLLQPNSPGCPQGLAPKARLYGWKVLDTGLSPKPSNSVLAQFPTFSHGTLCQATAQTAKCFFHTVVFIRHIHKCLPIITGSNLCPVTSAPLKPQLFRMVTPLGFKPYTGILQQNPQLLISFQLNE